MRKYLAPVVRAVGGLPLRKKNLAASFPGEWDAEHFPAGGKTRAVKRNPPWGILSQRGVTTPFVCSNHPSPPAAAEKHPCAPQRPRSPSGGPLSQPRPRPTSGEPVPLGPHPPGPGDHNLVSAWPEKTAPAATSGLPGAPNEVCNVRSATSSPAQRAPKAARVFAKAR